MSKMTRSSVFRIAIATAIYAALVVIACFIFQWMSQNASVGSHLPYVVCGPALALFTHMSYSLFATQSLFLLPWLVWGALQPRVKTVAILCFCVGWLACGWYMYDLF